MISSNKHVGIRVATLFAILLASCLSIWGQATTSSSIVGQVTDSTLAAIPAADVTLTDRPWTSETIFAFVRAAGDAILPSYLPILERRASTPSTDAQRRWQLLRRGRYVEFNLVYDRGTKFGLMTPGARIESILISLPEVARWEYRSEVGSEAESEEGKLLEVLRKPRVWVE